MWFMIHSWSFVDPDETMTFLDEKEALATEVFQDEWVWMQTISHEAEAC